jgi:hypothetical protein
VTTVGKLDDVAKDNADVAFVDQTPPGMASSSVRLSPTHRCVTATLAVISATGGRGLTVSVKVDVAVPHVYDITAVPATPMFTIV